MTLLLPQNDIQPDTRLAACFHAGVLLDLFEPEDGDDMVLRNFGWLSTGYTALYPCEDLRSYTILVVQQL
jgi:hypothetical protein